MVNHLKASIVRISNAAGSIAGSGFLVSEKQVLTCSHVIAQVLGISESIPDLPTGEVRLDFPFILPGKTFTARVVFWLPVKSRAATQALEAYPEAEIEDIAVVELQDDPPNGSTPVRLVALDSLWGHKFRAFGFPKRQPNGVWVTGKLLDMQTSGLVQIEKADFFGYSVERGFSGTPVWDDEVNGVVGMVVTIEEKPEIRAAFIIPTDTLVKVWPRLKSQVVSQKAIRHQYYHFVHGYSLPVNWAGRDRELEMFSAYVGESRYRIIAITAIGGTGKSALTRKLLEDLVRREVVLDGCFWFSFYSEADVDRFLVEACRYWIPNFDPREYPSPFAKSSMLLDALAPKRGLLVLDGLETMLVADRKGPKYGAFKDRALRDFLRGMCGDQGSSQIIITARWPPTELTGLMGYQNIQLSDLSPEDALEYMLRQGVKGSQDRIKSVCSHYGNHVLTLYVLSDYLSHAPFQGDITGVDSLQQLPSETPQGAKLHSILEGYWQKLTRPERFFMTRLSTFRSNVTEDAFKVMVIDDDGHPCEISHPVFHRSLRRLSQSALMSIEYRGKKTTYTAHPLIKNYFYERLGFEERRKVHIELKDYAESIPLPDEIHSLEDLDSLLESHYHNTRAELYDEAYEVYRRKRLLEQRIFWWGHYSLAIQLLQPLLDAYTKGAWSPNVEKAHWLLVYLAWNNSKAGHPELAVQQYRKSIQISEDDHQLLLRSYLHLSELLIEMGKLREAQQSLQDAEKVMIQSEKLNTNKFVFILGRQGYCNAALGNFGDAIEQLTKAIDSSYDIDVAFHCLLLRVRGDLYLHSNYFSEAHADYIQGLKIACDHQNSFKDYEGHILRGLGDYYRLRMQYEQAMEQYHAALMIAKNTGYIWLESEVRIGLALLALSIDDFKEAADQAAEVLNIVGGSGFFIQQIQAHVVIARFFLNKGDDLQMANHVQSANQLLADSDHYLSRKQLEKLLETAKTSKTQEQ